MRTKRKPAKKTVFGIVPVPEHGDLHDECGGKCLGG